MPKAAAMKWTISLLALSIALVDYATAEEAGTMTATGLVVAGTDEDAPMAGIGAYWTREHAVGGYLNFASSETTDC